MSQPWMPSGERSIAEAHRGDGKRYVASNIKNPDKSHHQVAAVDIEGRAGDVAGGLGSGEAN